MKLSYYQPDIVVGINQPPFQSVENVIAKMLQTLLLPIRPVDLTYQHVLSNQVAKDAKLNQQSVQDIKIKHNVILSLLLL